MAVAKVFRSGNSQAVRLPKEFRFDSDEVDISRRGDEVVLRPRKADMSRALELIMSMSEEMFDDIQDLRPPQPRKGL
ncbi:MAG: virulence factor [Enterovirga sp.]|jgi:antitoxin VapB|nr:virulence factor [Enterovirga sp.]